MCLGLISHTLGRGFALSFALRRLVGCRKEEDSGKEEEMEGEVRSGRKEQHSAVIE